MECLKRKKSVSVQTHWIVVNKLFIDDGKERDFAYSEKAIGIRNDSFVIRLDCASEN